jgi:hypothetical protein
VAWRAVRNSYMAYLKRLADAEDATGIAAHGSQAAKKMFNGVWQNPNDPICRSGFAEQSQSGASFQPARTFPIRLPRLECSGVALSWSGWALARPFSSRFCPI